ncbi:MAG: hypothetical protein MUE83_03515 [Tabrizicola sp.]|jgi:hypothetical protein|nr:hypothetical protein [Tabrizicola sp.]
MASPDEELTVAQRLGRALDRGLLPAGGPAEAAERLIERLERPARIALLGLPGSGKSSILNLLVGKVVVQETLRLPTIIVQHGDTARMICTLTDGSTKILPGSDLADVLPLAPALVTLEMDLAALKVISLLEVSAGPMEAEQKRAATWASKRADIVIWCTTSYLPKEQVVWESLPDTVKDNSFMFLTKVDLLGSRQQASAMHDRVELRAGEEFRQILSISAKEARAAVPPGGPVNRDLFRDSGAAAVIAAIKTRVQSGRRADMDTAELLLARHVEASELVARRFSEPGVVEAQPAPWTPPPEPEAPSDTVEVEFEEELAEEVIEDEVAESAGADVDEPGDEDPDDIEEEDPAEADVDATDAELEPEPESEPEPEQQVETVSRSLSEDPDQPVSRKRFADRIKRVASDSDPVASPMVPLRSTWKSKAELEAPPEPTPEPPVRAPEPVRRPRGSAPPVEDEGDVARMLANITSSPEQPSAPTRPALPRERAPGVPTPRPAAEVERGSEADESPAAVRPKLFGAARSAAKGLTPGSPLPDLSSLRARPEEMSDEAALDEVDQTDTSDVRDIEEPAEEVDAVEDAAVLPEPEPEPEPEPDPEPQIDAPPPRPAAPVERPRLFGRDPRPRPSEPVAQPVAEAMPRVTPISRLPASARAAAAPAPAPTPASVASDDTQFTPRAIMMRERRPEPEAQAPRRERPRIAARAVPASDPGPAPALDAGVDQGLAAEAIGVILSRSADLQGEIDPEAKIPVDMILDHARETGELVMQIVSRGRSDAMRRINSDLGEVLDLIMLMQLEKGHAPADDALTLLLQLRRELETLRAV